MNPHLATFGRTSNHPSRGLGDTVDKVLTAKGVAAVVEKVNGGPCVSCAKRREALNGAAPYNGAHNGKDLSP